LALSAQVQAVADGIAAIASQAKLPFPANVAAVASTVLALAKAIGTVKKLLSGFKAEKGAVFTSGQSKKINPVAGVSAVGQRHSGGGIQMIDGKTGQHLGEWERGEPYLILSRATYSNNRDVIDQLLYNSLYKGGAPVYAASGAVVGALPAAIPGPAAKAASEGGTQLLALSQAVDRLDFAVAKLIVRIDEPLLAVLDADEAENTLRQRAAARGA